MAWKIENWKEKCLLCLNSQTSSISMTFPSFPGTGKEARVGVHFLQGEAKDQQDQSCLSSNLWSIFLLRKFLQFPEKQCHSLLQKTFGGVNPGSWFSLCDQCSELVQNAYQLHFQITRLERQLKLLREAAFEKLKTSFEEPGEEDGNGNMYLSVDDMIRNYYRRRLCKQGGKKDKGDPLPGGSGDQEVADVEDGENYGTAFIMEFEEDLEHGSVKGDAYEDSSDSDFVLDDEKDGEDEEVSSINSESDVDVDLDENENSPMSDNSATKESTLTPRQRSTTTTSTSRNLLNGYKLVGEDKYKCETCEAIMEGKRNLNHHKQAHRLTCDRCGYKNRRMEKFNIHVRSHKINDNIVPAADGDGDKSQFSCKLCDFVGARNTVYRHVSNVHFSDEMFQCPLCPKKFTSRKHTKLHVQSIHGLTGNYKCHCKRWFLTPECLEKHMKTHDEDEESNPKGRKRKRKSKEEEEDDGKQFNCDVCEETVEGTKAFEKHSRIHKTMCFRCGYQNRRSEKVARHVRSHKINDNIIQAVQSTSSATAPDPNSSDPQPKPTITPDEFLCKLCGFDGGRQVVYRHISLVHFADSQDMTPSLCDICSLSFPSRHRLRDHVRQVHEKRCCDQCPARFSSKRDFDDHIQWHANGGLSTILCEKCGNAFPTRTALSQHLKQTISCGHGIPSVSTNVKIKSDKEARRRRKPEPKRERLIDTVPGEGNKCRFCGEMSFNRTALNTHLRQAHPEQFKYKCELCEDVFYSSHNGWKSHMERVHYKKKLECPKGCGYISDDTRKMTRHLGKQLCGKVGRQYGRKKEDQSHQQIMSLIGLDT